MYIEPNTIIRILKNCPLNNTYEHTIYFVGVTAQTAYFTGLTKHTLDKQNYQRVNKGKMRVAIKAEELYDCNYIMFQNASFGSKWFYAFIKSVEYVNNITSEIEFEIDVMQTWFFDYKVMPCFVEREHAMDDRIGANTVPENLETGDYIISEIEGTNLLKSLCVIAATTYEYDGSGITVGDIFKRYQGDLHSGIYSGLYYNLFDLANDPLALGRLKTFLSNVDVNGKSDGVVSIFMMPSVIFNGIKAGTTTHTITKPKNTSKLGSYTDVKNKKLFTHPYNFMCVSNMQGTTAVFPYEFFSEQFCTFEICGDISCNPGVLMYPTNYKGVSSNYDEKLTLNGFPQCAYNNSVYLNWLAQNGMTTAINAIGGVATSTVGTLASAALASTTVGAGAALAVGAVSAASKIGSTLATFAEKSVLPPQAKGTSSNSTLAANNLLDFWFMSKHIKPEFAKIIDDYFSLYGYATKKVKIPNRNGRPCWNYVKTVGANLKGTSGLPADDLRKIISIYDSGITFWKRGDEVGNYELDNTI